jgi:hypothetical protein
MKEIDANVVSKAEADDRKLTAAEAAVHEVMLYIFNMTAEQIETQRKEWEAKHNKDN